MEYGIKAHCPFSSADAWEPSGHYNSSTERHKPTQISLTQKYTDVRTGKHWSQFHREEKMLFCITEYFFFIETEPGNKIQLQKPEKPL